ncbi:phage tail assembly protein [Brucella anthropi]|uniref:phage tail assembly protein n=1 Tax=Brucella anthropi TaxID=529 RepID=UPI00124CA3DD|nr:phage tail assembly protein [Brucella anthropi]KAB2788124.1 phage tail assembly protein [Brucella anthropi]
MSDTQTIKLSKAYKLGGTNAEEITIREPKLADLIVVENIAKGGGNNAVMALMIAQLSGATQPEVTELSLADYQKCAKVVSPFLNQASPAGDD